MKAIMLACEEILGFTNGLMPRVSLGGSLVAAITGKPSTGAICACVLACVHICACVLVSMHRNCI